jgi:hypothetical protein
MAGHSYMRNMSERSGRRYDGPEGTTNPIPKRKQKSCQLRGPIKGRSTYPRGNLARTSTFPYRMLRFPLVEMRALMAGLMTAPDVALLTAPHAVRFVLVQPVKLNVCPSKIPSRPMTSDVSVGRMYSSPFRMNELFDDAVVISNSPFLFDAH